ncbi:flagellar basal-body rod protein FlgF [Nitratireductor aquimarinus]|uniref:Flagellar basal-body rod protein FlgF n=1 Tax=Nitratireductor aquimarinus TaxID=889300 RepID=A0ABU4AGK9_9HYPH|nr:MULTISPECIES: flagellar basal-body rod protein FlgF [Alphaproteobacteria]MBY6021688.1 flagellar basal-body rod protein FlgF [Nitratireductor sp. DP7N14-4]MBN7756721.1 flagellar basal-body rod protein FlgF [Nitratireductor aquimarinus]MBN7761902.1 flagellar basal-body rod protein FlgF [Nitratireductor aquibiodomus]MBN7775166.1 flagellar basal-body rod protein FlgF [Nitratireductor pacificus]MBN7781180.1 flagellar basal-body rod protein FlgF [Nitratireductor pacificus]
MQTGLYVALSSQVALEKRLGTLADNVANAGTVGFRGTSVNFRDLVSGDGPDSVSFAAPGSPNIDTHQGGLRETKNPFDFAVQGEAWFGLETPAGTVVTRDGRFTMRETGELVSLDGHPVLDAGGAPLLLDPLAGPPEASADGTLRQNGQLVGAIGLYEFAPSQNYARFGNSGFVADDAQPVVDQPGVGVAQGFVEEANVNPVQQMMNLIEVQRTFEHVSALMSDSDTALKDAIKLLGG